MSFSMGHQGLTMAMPLDGERIIDLSSGIAGGYCTRMLADAGATVIKVESPAGDPLRRRSIGRTLAGGEDGALFGYLACTKQSVVVDPTMASDRDLLERLFQSADGVVWSSGSGIADAPEHAPVALRRLAPQATILSLSPFGLTGPWADRPANDAVLQALSGGPGQRGTLDTPPLIVGGSLGDYATGLVGVVSYLISRHRRVRHGTAELVDVSGLETQCLTMTMYPATFLTIAGFPMRPVRMTNLPGIHASRDGYVGFMVVTGQQWLDFTVMVGHREWGDDGELARLATRSNRRHELLPIIDAWMAERSSDEIVDFASALRIPVAALGNGANLPSADHLVEHAWYAPSPSGAFLQPRVPYRLGAGTGSRPYGAAPRLGEQTEMLRRNPPAARPPRPATQSDRPFAGLRVVDFSNNWAGPIIGHILAMFGADVIKIESANRPDPLRFNTIKSMTEDGYWEWSPLQHGPNTCKRGVTLEMSSARGRELALDLIRHSDVVIENYSPRVMDSWGLTAEAIADANPAAVYLRAPAYGLTGPWRDRVGYAQTIEMTSGLAWLTGGADQPPEIPNGPCDPIAGLHATVALLISLEHRRRTGRGMMVEVPMIGGALSMGAEQVIEFSSSGMLLERDGNRSPVAAPQGAYLASDDDLPFGQGRWVMISVETDAQWLALRSVLGEPDGLTAVELAAFADRRVHHDLIDEFVSGWCSSRPADEIVDMLVAAGVPAAKIVLPHEQVQHEQLLARGWFSEVDHPVVGKTVHGGFPARFEAGPHPAELHTAPPPTLGQHNHAVLRGILGLSETQMAELEADNVIGTKVGGGRAW